MIAKPQIEFATPDYIYDEMQDQMRAYSPGLEKYPHDIPSIISIEEGLRAGAKGDQSAGSAELYCTGGR